MTPLNIDKILTPIPLLGSVLNETLAYATQMIFYLQLEIMSSASILLAWQRHGKLRTLMKKK